jgi:hypothetical protein
LNEQPTGQSPGPATDRHNEPVIDPTKNVLDLVAAETRRQDDLRELTEAGVRRALESATLHLTELSTLRADYEDKLRAAETSRIDAIRQVDVGNVQRAAEVQATQASALAAQVVASAEALRNQVAAAASAASIALAAALEPVQKDIADLRRAQYEAQGQKTQVVETRASGASTGLWVGVAVAGVGLLIAATVLIVALTNQGGTP